MADISLKIKSDFAQAQKDFNNLKMTSEDVRQKIEKFQKSFKTEQIDKFIAKNKLNAAAIRATKGPMAAVISESKGLQREMQRLIRSGLDPQSAEVIKLQKNYVKLQSQLVKTDKKEKKLGSTFKTVTASILAAGAIDKVVRKVGSAFTFMINEARRIEDATAAFTPLMGGLEKSKKLVDAMNIAAAKTPFQFGNIAKTVQQLLPVMNQDIEKTIDTFNMLGDTAGGNAQRLESITRGYSKAMLKNKVDMESLQMIAEAGVPIFTEMAKTMGLGKNEMDKFFKVIKTGKVGTDALTQTFKNMTSEGGLFFRGMILASQTTSGVLSTMSDVVALTAGVIGNLFLPMIKEAAIFIINIASAVRKWLTDGDNLKNLLENIASVVKILALVLTSYAAAILLVTIAQKAQIAIGWLQYLWLMRAAIIKTIFTTNLWAVAQRALNVVMNMNPIALIAIAIGLLIFAIYKLVKNWDAVKFAVVDFVRTAQIKLLSLGITIRSKLMGAISGMLKKFSKLPIIGKYFKGIEKSQWRAIKSMKNYRWQIIKAQKAARAAFKESQKQNSKGSESNKKLTESQKVASDSKILGYRKLASASNKTLKQQMKDAQKWIDLAKNYGLTEAEIEVQKFEEQNRQLKLAFNRKLITTDEFQKAQLALTEEHNKKLNKLNKKSVQNDFNTFKNGFNAILGAFTNMISSISALSKALNKAELDRLDNQMNAELKAAGVLEATTLEQAQREHQAAIQTGNALDIEEKRRAVEKIKIEEKYQAQKDELEYQGALASWGYQMALAVAQAPMAVLNAITAGWAFGPVGAAAFGIAAGIAAGAQVAAVGAAMPTKAETGLTDYRVPDIAQFKNDNAPVMAGPGETVNVTPRSEENEKNEYNFSIGEDKLFSVITKGIRTGKIDLSDRNLGSGVFT